MSTATTERLIESVFTDEAGPLPVSLYLTTITRERVGRMSPDDQAAALGAWQAAGFPAARDAEGNSVHLESDQLRAISMLLRSFERTLEDITVVRAITDRLDELSDGEQWTVREVGRGHGIENPRGLLFTDGELFTLGRIIDRVVALRDEGPAPSAVDLDPLPQPGRVVATPVDDADDLAMVPPDGKVSDVERWVDGDPAKAAKALAAERARAKPRKTLVGKLELLADHDAAPAPEGEAEPLEQAVQAKDFTGTIAALADKLDARLDDVDPFDGINGEAPIGSGESALVAAVQASGELQSGGLLEALAEAVERGKAAHQAPEPMAPAPSVTLAGGRLTPEHALERIGAAVAVLTSTVADLEQLAERIRAEN